MAVIDVINIKSAKEESGFVTRDIGAQAYNVTVSYDNDDRIVTNKETTVKGSESLSQTLNTINDDVTNTLRYVENINDQLVNSYAQKVHSSETSEYGAASKEAYGHVKIGDGIQVEDGVISVSTIQGKPLNFSDGVNTVTYDSSREITITADNLGALTNSHLDLVASDTALGHIKSGVGVIVDDGAMNVKYGGEEGTSCEGNDPRLSDTREPNSHANENNIYGGGTSTHFGHVKVTDVYSVDTPSEIETGADTSIVPSAYALQSAYDDLSTQMAEVKKSVSDGKSKLASAITEKGVSTLADATFDEITTNINNITPRIVYIGTTAVSGGAYGGAITPPAEESFNIKNRVSKDYPNLTTSNFMLALNNDLRDNSVVIDSHREVAFDFIPAKINGYDAETGTVTATSAYLPLYFDGDDETISRYFWVSANIYAIY